jgi:hypothetical protein
MRNSAQGITSDFERCDCLVAGYWGEGVKEDVE